MAVYTSDSFTDADGTTLSGHAPDIAGTAYDVDNADSLIESNALTNSDFSSSTARANPPPASADYKATGDFTCAAGSGTIGARLVLRSQNAPPENSYNAGYDVNIGGWFISIIASGTETVLDSVGTPAMSVGDTSHVEFEASGTALTLTVDSVLLLTVIDATYSATGQGGLKTVSLLQGWWTFDNFTVEDGSGGGGVHVVSGRGSVALSGQEWLSTSISGRPSILSSGAAEPPNWYHVGMLSWGTANGAMQSYPVTRDLDLVHIPSGLDTLWYEFIAGVTATITELASP